MYDTAARDIWQSDEIERPTRSSAGFSRDDECDEEGDAKDKEDSEKDPGPDVDVATGHALPV